MQISRVFLSYIARRFTFHFAGFFAACITLVFLACLTELLRRTAGKPDIGFDLVIQMAFLQAMGFAEKILFFVAMSAALSCFLSLGRNEELVAARAAGVSIWQSLIPVLALSAAAGLLTITIFNPVAALFANRFAELEAAHIKGRTSLIAISDTGLWLRETSQDGPSVTHALRAGSGGKALYDVTIFLYDKAGGFASRADAETARLRDGYWELRNVWLSKPNATPQFTPSHRQKTLLTPVQVQDSFARPETISFWNLRRFIALAELAGFSALNHRMHYYSLLALPFSLAAMALFGASIALLYAPTRRGPLLIWFFALIGGFSIYFLDSLARALGVSNLAPLALAVSTPVIAAASAGLTIMLYREEA